jgi:hypothetical protein
MKGFLSLACLIFACFAPPPAFAQGATMILVPGAGGASPRDFLIRNQSGLAAAGATLVVALSSGEIVAAARRAKASGGRVSIVGMSAGAPKVGQALAQGAPADRVVIVSGILMPNGMRPSMAQAMRSPARLPPTLIVHNRMDDCPLTSPQSVPAFVNWAGGRAQVAWIESGGGPGQPCGPLSAHGHFGADGQAVSAITSFAR